MTIPNFSGQQNEFYVPVLLWLLVATVCAMLPIIVWPALARAKRRNLVVVLSAAGLVVGLVGAGLSFGPAQHALEQQRIDVKAQIETRYGFDLSAAHVAKLIDGNELVLPSTGTTDPVHLVAYPADSNTFKLVHTISAQKSVQPFPVIGH